ncbi:MAG: 16S rRNA (guanine(966)-N(2))-methyltransferase RsmD [Desulfovibrionaceae bacterium]|nr:16S rRNA (guanine(966)-N(2))-methyltransferase RsmD [Desulfovibrionaceae bacterium]
MRIIAGQFRSRVLQTPKGSICRPAMGRTRAAIFSMLTARGLNFTTTYVLDLFAGSGSLAFEALSRGALGAVLVENAAPCIKCLERNRGNLGLETKVTIDSQDVLQFLRKESPQTFGLVFLDPPYRRDVVNQALELLCSGNWLTEGAFVLCELEAEYQVTFPEPLKPCWQRRFGQTLVSVANFASTK